MRSVVFHIVDNPASWVNEQIFISQGVPISLAAGALATVMDVPWLVCQLHPPFYPKLTVSTSEKMKCIYPVGTILVQGTTTEGVG